MKKIIHYTKGAVVMVSLALPSLLLAATPYAGYDFPSGAQANLTNVIWWAFNVVNGLVIPGIFSLAIIAFLWGVLQSIRKAEDKEARIAGANFMLYGIIGLTVMFSFWALVGFVLNSFHLTPPGGQLPPQFVNPLSGLATGNSAKFNSFSGAANGDSASGAPVDLNSLGGAGGPAEEQSTASGASDTKTDGDTYRAWCAQNPNDKGCASGNPPAEFCVNNPTNYYCAQANGAPQGTPEEIKAAYQDQIDTRAQGQAYRDWCAQNPNNSGCASGNPPAAFCINNPTNYVCTQAAGAPQGTIEQIKAAYAPTAQFENDKEAFLTYCQKNPTDVGCNNGNPLKTEHLPAAFCADNPTNIFCKAAPPQVFPAPVTNPNPQQIWR